MDREALRLRGARELLSKAPVLVIAFALTVGACSGGSPNGARGRVTTTRSVETIASIPATRAAVTGTSPCGHGGRPPRRYDHVIWIWMENHSRSAVIGTRDAPYETALARQCGTAAKYADVASPSLPNYIGATSGSTYGITDDADPSTHRIAADNLFRQVRMTGATARSYEESMPANCTLTSRDRYAVKHNPAAYYIGPDRSACAADDVPLGTIDGGPFRRALDHATLPAFAFVAPNLCHDTHDCSVATGDAFLRQWIPAILASRAATTGTTAIFVVWDEPTPMPFLAIAATIPAGTIVSSPVDHYTLLRTTEELLDLTPLLGKAAAAPSMRTALGL